MMQIYRRLWLGISVLLLLATSACDLVTSGSGTDTADRTLPEALDVRRVPLDTARYAIDAPDTVNVAVYVIQLKICPEGYNCFLPDGIEIAKTSDPEEGASRIVFVESPRQFVTKRRYLMSLVVTPSSNPNREENGLELLGYSRLEVGGACLLCGRQKNSSGPAQLLW